jgi:FAD/FMN-containing dehydrogenase
MYKGLSESVKISNVFDSFEQEMLNSGFTDIKGKIEAERREIIDSGNLMAIENRIYGYGAKDCSELYMPPKYYFRPKTIEQLRTIVKSAYNHKTPLTVASGKTGLSAGYATFAALVDLDILAPSDEIIQFSENQDEITASQHVLIADLIKLVPIYTKKKYIFPIQPSSAFKLPVRVGGMIASNASGVTSGKLGACESWVKEMTIMLPNGDIKVITKENDESMFNRIIGMNGFYGIILDATFKLYEPIKQLENRVIYGTDINEAFNGLQQVQDAGIFPLNSEYVMSHKGLTGKLGTLSDTQQVNWAVLIKGTIEEVEKFSDIMSQVNGTEVKKVSDAEFKVYLEERTNQGLVVESSDSGLGKVKFPGFEDILAPPAELVNIMANVNQIMKKYGFDEIVIGYGHLNFRKGRGLLLHSRIPVPVEMLADNREENMKVLAEIIVEVNLLLRDKYNIRAKEEHSSGAFGVWFDKNYRNQMQEAMDNGTAFVNPHMLIFNAYMDCFKELGEAELLEKIVYLYLRNA